MTNSDVSGDFGGSLAYGVNDIVEIANRALQVLGTRTTVTYDELKNQTTNEAIQLQLQMDSIRRRLIRMAPWNFATKTANLVYITSAPGTPENTSAPTTLWQPGQPAPPWAYEYQYPVDCLRILWLIPSTQTGFSGGVPITTAVTGGAASFWNGPPVKFKVQNDTFYNAVGAGVQNGGTNYRVGDVITLWAPPNTSPPNGAPAQCTVTQTSDDGKGIITNVQLIPTIYGTRSIRSGSYFVQPPNPQPQGSTTGSGVGALINLYWGGPQSQRVILTNQEFAIGSYLSNVQDPALMDDDFQEAWVKCLGATVTMALTGDKKLANLALQEANSIISQARTTDGNEGFTINDVTPDWIRIRGTAYPSPYAGPYTGFDFGGLWPMYG